MTGINHCSDEYQKLKWELIESIEKHVDGTRKAVDIWYDIDGILMKHGLVK